MNMRVKDDSGFTLPELMISIVILGIITSAISMALIVGLKNDADTSRRMAESHDAQLIAINLPSDVHSTSMVAGSVVVAPTANADCSGMSNLLRLRWAEQLTSSGPVVTYVAAYAIPPGSTELVRHYCVDGGAAAETVVARNLAVSCGPPACQATVNGRTVTLKLTHTSGYTYSVVGTRRAS